MVMVCWQIKTTHFQVFANKDNDVNIIMVKLEKDKQFECFSVE